jgi:uncharacterized C2H2 Zn-finger protein
MKISVLSDDRVSFISCPQCGNRTSHVSGHSAKCPRCKFKFAVDDRSSEDFYQNGLKPPYIAFSGRYGGPFAGKLSATTTSSGHRVHGPSQYGE